MGFFEKFSLRRSEEQGKKERLIKTIVAFAAGLVIESNVALAEGQDNIPVSGPGKGNVHIGEFIKDGKVIKGNPSDREAVPTYQQMTGPGPVIITPKQLEALRDRSYGKTEPPKIGAGVWSQTIPDPKNQENRQN